MPRTFTKLTLLLTLVTACGQDVEVGDATPDAAPVEQAAPAAADTFVPDEAIIEVAAPLTLGEPVTLGGQAVVPISALSPGIYQVRLVDSARSVAGGDRAARTLDMIAALRAGGGVRAAVPNVYLEASAAPSDPVYVEQAWHYGVAGITAAWTRTTGSAGVRLAIIDSGSTPHPDLAWGPGIDVIDGDADPLDLGAYHHGTMVAGIAGARANGTGGVGVCWNCQLIPVRQNRSLGQVADAINRVANVDGHTATVLGPRRAEVINLSVNLYQYPSEHPNEGQRTHCTDGDTGVVGVRNAIAAARAQGVLVVVSAGNGGGASTPATDGPEFPADCPDAFSVAAISRPDLGGPGYTRAWYASHGPGLDLAAPGGGRNAASNAAAFYGADIAPPIATPCRHLAVDGSYAGTAGIVSSWAVGISGALLGGTPDDFCYRYGSGTSFAAPHVTGIAGLMLSARPGLTPTQLESVLRLTAKPDGTDLGFLEYLDCQGCGAGLVDADAAVAAVQAPTPAIAAVPAQVTFASIAVGQSGTATVDVGSVGFAALTVSGTPSMRLSGPFTFAYASGACTSGQTCGRTFTVPIGASTAVPLRCTPTVTGLSTGWLEIHGNSVGQVRVPLACTGTGAPQLSVASSLGFGGVLVNSSSNQTLRVTNTGSAPLNLTGASFSVGGVFTLQPSPLPTNIAANGGFADLIVRCAPTAEGLATSTLTLFSNANAGSVSLSCTGIAPRISTPASVSVGGVVVGSFGLQAVRVTNTGTAPLNVTSASFNLTNAITLLTNPPPTNIAANGGFADLIVRCAPSAEGLVSNTLSIGSTGGSASVSLTCTGVAARITAPGSLGFGNVRVNSSSSLTLRITNTGTAPLNLTGASVTGSTIFSLPSPSLPTNIAANGGFADLLVRCAPTAMGTFSATLTLASNAINGPANVALTCAGVAPQLTSTPSWVEFSSVLRTTTATQYLYITNSGTAPLTLASATTSGAPFSIGTTLPVTVAVGGTSAIAVRCSPTAPGYNQGTITVNHDAGAPLTVGTGCNGVEGRITVLAPLSALDLQAGESATATIRNDGVGPLYIGELRFSEDAPGLSFSGVTLPVTLPVGGTLTWSVDCTAAPGYQSFAKVYAKHDGLQEGSLFGVTCTQPAIWIEPPVEEDPYTPPDEK